VLSRLTCPDLMVMHDRTRQPHLLGTHCPNVSEGRGVFNIITKPSGHGHMLGALLAFLRISGLTVQTIIFEGQIFDLSIILFGLRATST
jgi:hypothetical protein